MHSTFCVYMHLCYINFCVVVFSFVCPFLRGRKCSVVLLHHYYVIYICIAHVQMIMFGFAILNGKRMLLANVRSASICQKTPHLTGDETGSENKVVVCRI